MSRFINPDAGFILKNGNPNALGKVYFGDPNTDAKTNPKAPFLDAALTLPAATTQALDAGGRFAQELFLSGSYSIIADDSADILVEEVLSYSGISDQASGITYTPTATVEQKLNNLDVDDYVELRLVPSAQLVDGDTINVTDGGIGGPFIVRTGTVTDNSMTLIVFADDSSRYAQRDFVGELKASWAGDGTLNSANLQLAVDYAISVKPVQLGIYGAWNITTPITLDAGISTADLQVVAVWDKSTVLTKTTTTTRGALTRLEPARVTGNPGTDTDDYDVNAIFVIVAPNGTNTREFALLGKGTMTATGAAKDTAIGIFAPRIARAEFQGNFEDLGVGIECRNLFLIKFTKIDFRDCVWGFKHSRTPGDFGGTSVHFDTVQHATCDHGLELDNLVYCAITACGVEEWAVGNYGFKAINRCIIAANGFGLENGSGPGIHVEGAANTSYSNATIGGKTTIDVLGTNWSLGKNSFTDITDFGIADATLFSRVIGDAALTVHGHWLQEFDSATPIICAVEFGSTAPDKIPVVTFSKSLDFGMTNAQFVSEGAGNRVTIATVTRNGKTLYGTNATSPTSLRVFTHLRKASNQVVSSTTPIALTFDAPAHYNDTEGLYNSATTSDGITVTSGGLYRVWGFVRVQSVSSGNGLEIRVKNTTTGDSFAAPIFHGDGSTNQMMRFDAVVPFFSIAGDLVIQVALTSGSSNVTIVGDNNLNQVFIELL